MIEDIQLRDLFKAESTEHLQILDDALLRLEKTPTDQDLLEEAFRAAHSLKGAARMLGLGGIQGPAHGIEDELNTARRGAGPLTPESIGRMSTSLVALRQLVAEAVSEPGTAAGPDALASAGTRAGSDSGGGLTAAGSPAVARGSTAAETNAANAGAPFRIESVRVDTRRLDALMTHAGELMVTRSRVSRRLSEIARLIESLSQATPSPTTAGSQPGSNPEGTALEELRTSLSEDSARLDAVANELEQGIRQIRLLPLSTLFSLFPRLVHDIAEDLGKRVELIIEGGEANADKRIIEDIKDPLMHILRNAVDHGIESAPARELLGKPAVGRVSIRATQEGSSVTVEVSDDGRGLDEEAIGRAALKRGLITDEVLKAMAPSEVHALILLSGLSTAGFVTDISGRGVGMSVVRTNVEKLNGSIAIESTRGLGASVTLRLPVTLASARVLIVEAGGHAYGLPMDAVRVLRNVRPDQIFAVEGRKTFLHEGRAVSVARLADLLELPTALSREKRGHDPESLPCAVLARGGETLGVFVDALLDEQDVVLKAGNALVGSGRNVAGAAILDNGEICTVIEVRDLMASVREQAKTTVTPVSEAGEENAKNTVLLVEDSLATRMQETRILESAGYDVVTATDGLDAYNKLATRAFDAVVTDINMPNLDGLGLTERIRREPRYAELPIVLVTSLSSDLDRKRGLEAGANAYITKSGFDQRALLDCLERLIG